MTTTARDLEKSKEIYQGLDWRPERSEVVNAYAQALAAERASLPQSVCELVEWYARGETREAFLRWQKGEHESE